MTIYKLGKCELNDRIFYDAKNILIEMGYNVFEETNDTRTIRTYVNIYNSKYVDVITTTHIPMKDNIYATDELIREVIDRVKEGK